MTFPIACATYATYATETRESKYSGSHTFLGDSETLTFPRFTNHLHNKFARLPSKLTLATVANDAVTSVQGVSKAGNRPKANN